ncbi:MAG: hypothetical protein H7320_07985, partial [Ferruginibacter sp.]|nr:hypothetical protein [Ferruginibacter sp.]
MKKVIIAAAILLAANTGVFAQDSTHKASTHKQKMTTSKKYTCTMHPEVMMDKPGKCPKCGMKLVAIKSGKKMKGMKM